MCVSQKDSSTQQKLEDLVLVLSGNLWNFNTVWGPSSALKPVFLKVAGFSLSLGTLSLNHSLPPPKKCAMQWTAFRERPFSNSTFSMVRENPSKN